LGLVPFLVAFLCNLWNRPEYQFFPLALAGAGWIAWTRAKQITPEVSSGSPVLVGLFFLLSLGGFAIALFLWSPWLGAIAAYFALVGVAWWIGGLSLFRAILPAFLILAAIIPPPLGMDVRFGELLRGLAVRWSSRMLDLLGVIHCVSGNVIELPRQKLLVQEACSGINSLLFVCTFTLFYLAWKRRTVFVYLACLPLAAGLVLAGNVARITLGAWLRSTGGVDLLSGWPHEALGLVLIAVYLGLVASFEHLIFYPKIPTDEGGSLAQSVVPLDPESKEPCQPGGNAGSRLFRPWGLVLASVFALIGLLSIGRAWIFYRHIPLPGKSLEVRVSAFSIPEQIGGWKRVTSLEPIVRKLETQGVSSQIWEYKNGGTIASVSFDYPFWDYHDVTVCYATNGWSILRRELVKASLPGEPDWMELDMKKEPIGFGQLWFSTVDGKGNWLEVPLMARSFSERFKGTGLSDTANYRVQVLITGVVPLDAPERESAKRLFEEVRARLISQLLAANKGKAGP
jgi:exosortase